MKISPFGALLISFLTWLSIGVLLLYKGLKIFVDFVYAESKSLAIDFLSHQLGSKEFAVLLCISLSVLVGFMKGRLVLKKTVNRLSNRFFSFGRPMKIQEMYPRYYLFVLIGMMSLGMGIKFLPVPLELRAFVDVAVGAGLTNGAMQYFNLAFSKGRGIA